MKRSEINDFIRSHRQFSREELAAECGLSKNAIEKRESRMKLPFRDEKVVPEPKTSEEVTAEARLESKVRGATLAQIEISRKYKALQDELLRAEHARDQAMHIFGYKPKITKIKAGKKAGGCATVCALLSDVHCEEVVPAYKVNFLNEHNPDISKRRVHRFFDLLVKFIRVDRAETRVDNLLLWLGGDFFTSDAHDAPVDMGPMIAAMYAQDMIVSGIKFLMEQEPNLKILAVGSVGNHSRKNMAKPVNQALEQENSLEWMMYHSIKEIFAGEANITFQLDNSYHTYVDVYDRRIRFCHGHLGFRYNKGQAGLHGPLFKAIREVWDLQIKADLTCIGHYHTATPASLARPYITNGSTIGPSPYGIQFGYEPPSQTYFLIHNKFGIVGQRPLFVDT